MFTNTSYKNVGQPNICCQISDFSKFNRNLGFTAALMEGIRENRKVELPKRDRNCNIHKYKKTPKTELKKKMKNYLSCTSFVISKDFFKR